jgi:hypothetical protein
MHTPRHSCRLAIFADYHQFYVCDPKAVGSVPVDWTDQDVANRAKVGHGIVVICPARDMYVDVEVGIWDTEPQVIFDAWQHVIEAPLRTTGRIVIDQCTGESKACFTVEPGDYTVRALFRGLESPCEDQVEEHDFYEVQIWRSPCTDLRVIRQWK